MRLDESLAYQVSLLSTSQLAPPSSSRAESQRILGSGAALHTTALIGIPLPIRVVRRIITCEAAMNSPGDFLPRDTMLLARACLCEKRLQAGAILVPSRSASGPPQWSPQSAFLLSRTRPGIPLSLSRMLQPPSRAGVCSLPSISRLGRGRDSGVVTGYYRSNRSRRTGGI